MFGLILDPALRHTLTQGGTCGRVSHHRQSPVVGGQSGMLPGATALSSAVIPCPCEAEGLYAACWRCGPRWCAGRGGQRDHLQAGVRVPVFLGRTLTAALEFENSTDLVRFVQRWGFGACIAWGCRLHHCCVDVPESRQEVRICCSLSLPVVARVNAHVAGVGSVGRRAWQRSRSVCSRGLASWGSAGVIPQAPRGRLVLAQDGLTLLWRPALRAGSRGPLPTKMCS